MKVGHIFTKIGNFIDNRQIFMLLNRNCAKLANSGDFKHPGGHFFVDTVYIYICNMIWFVLGMQSQPKGSHTTSVGSLVVDEERMRSEHWPLGSIHCVSFSALTLLVA